MAADTLAPWRTCGFKKISADAAAQPQIAEYDACILRSASHDILLEFYIYLGSRREQKQGVLRNSGRLTHRPVEHVGHFGNRGQNRGQIEVVLIPT